VCIVVGKECGRAKLLISADEEKCQMYRPFYEKTCSTCGHHVNRPSRCRNKKALSDPKHFAHASNGFVNRKAICSLHEAAHK
jgi:hypothetical protein